MSGSAIFSAVFVVAAIACASPAAAGPTIASPREPNPKLDNPDSTSVEKDELGITVGSPAAVNLEVGYWPDRILGLRTSGMFYGTQFWCAQGGLCFTVRRRPTSRLALALVGATHQENRTYWNYGGVALDWNAHSFFAELGPVILWSNDANFSDRRVAAIAQFGIMGGGGILGPR